jgi:hypothetical protein
VILFIIVWYCRLEFYIAEEQIMLPNLYSVYTGSHINMNNKLSCEFDSKT